MPVSDEVCLAELVEHTQKYSGAEVKLSAQVMFKVELKYPLSFLGVLVGIIRGNISEIPVFLQSGSFLLQGPHQRSGARERTSFRVSLHTIAGGLIKDVLPGVKRGGGKFSQTSQTVPPHLWESSECRIVTKSLRRREERQSWETLQGNCKGVTLKLVFLIKSSQQHLLL